MRRFLQLPLTNQYTRMLADDHEWLIFTDVRLHPLIWRRGNARSIPADILEDTIEDLVNQVPRGGHITVYMLHTHPTTRTSVPSGRDLTVSVNLPHKYKNIIIKGTGVISERGILLTIFPEGTERRNDVRSAFGVHYREMVKSHIERKTRDPAVAERLTEGVYENKEEENIRVNAQARAFKKVVRDTKVIKTKMVEPNRRGRIHRRKGR